MLNYVFFLSTGISTCGGMFGLSLCRSLFLLCIYEHFFMVFTTLNKIINNLPLRAAQTTCNHRHFITSPTSFLALMSVHTSGRQMNLINSILALLSALLEFEVVTIF